MNLMTRNPGPNSRQIDRIVNKPVTSVGYGNYGVPVIRFRVEQDNGFRYYIELDDADLTALIKARNETYKEDFENAKAHQ